MLDINPHIKCIIQWLLNVQKLHVRYDTLESICLVSIAINEVSGRIVHISDDKLFRLTHASKI